MKRLRSLISLKSDDYHCQIDRIAGSLSPSDGRFPWDLLRDYADTIIRKQKDLTIPDGLDFFLSNFICEHKRKDIAVAACAHSLSRKCTLRLLTGYLRTEAQHYHSLPTYLQCIIAVNHKNPVAVGSEEAETARELILLLNQSDDHFHLLEPMIKKFLRGIPSSCLLAPHCTYLLELGITAHNAVLETLRQTVQWAHAYTAAAWLAQLPNLLPQDRHGHGYLNAEKVLDKVMPTWRSWASWRPQKQTLAMLADKVNTADRLALKDIFALEGPCFDHSNCSSLREGLASTAVSKEFYYESILFSFEHCDRQYVAKQLRRVLFLLFQAVVGDAKTYPNRIKLFKRVCLGRAISEAGLKILDVAFSNGDSLVIEAIRELLRAFDEGTHVEFSHSLVLFEVCIREDGKEINELFGQVVRDSVTKGFRAEQLSLNSIVIRNQRWIGSDRDVVMILQKMGQRLVDTPGALEAMGDVRPVLEKWPDMQEVASLCSIIMAARSSSDGTSNTLSDMVAHYLLARMVGPNSLYTHSLQLVKGLIKLWNATSDEDYRVVGILISRLSSRAPQADFLFQRRCIDSLTKMPSTELQTIKHILENTETKQNACTTLARFLISVPDYIETWREVLLQVIEAEGEKLVDWALQNLASEAWLQFMDDLAMIFEYKIPWDLSIESPFFLPTLHQWTQRVSQHHRVLNRLEQEESMRFGPAIRCLLRGGSLDLEEDLHRMLQLLDTRLPDTKWMILQKITARLHQDGSNAGEIRKVLSLVRGVTTDGDEALLHIMETYEEVSPEVAEIMLHSWHGELDLMPMDKFALESLASVLGLDMNENVPMDSLRTTENWIQDRYKDLLVEARRLESLRIAFKNLEAAETAALLEELGIEDTSPVDDLLQHLSPALVNVIDKVAENEVEMTIPLSSLTIVQRKAMGAGTAQNLLVRFSPGYAGMTPGFCLHFDGEDNAVHDFGMHQPCLILGDEPEEHECFGRKTPAIYQMSRGLSQEIRTFGFNSLSNLYDFLVKEVAQLSSKCVVCGALQGYNMRRTTVCRRANCEAIFKQTNLEVQLGDIRIDPAVVDLLLTAIYAAACQSSQCASLLTTCPITEPQRIKYVIDNMPAITKLQSASDLATAMRNMDVFQNISNDATTLLSWVCNSYRGFLTSVTPSLRIPSFPGTHQFLLANGSPSQEIAFASKIVGGSTRVMFHGTTMERLNAILREGLRDLSGSALQRHGQSYGRGVYLSSEPSTAWGYTYASSSWKGSNFSNYRVLLGVELAGNWSATSGHIHVITDVLCLMVRYVILCPNTAAVPIASHVVPAMQSVYNSLRSGAI